MGDQSPSDVNKSSQTATPPFLTPKSTFSPSSGRTDGLAPENSSSNVPTQSSETLVKRIGSATPPASVGSKVDVPRSPSRRSGSSPALSSVGAAVGEGLQDANRQGSQYASSGQPAPNSPLRPRLQQLSLTALNTGGSSGGSSPQASRQLQQVYARMMECQKALEGVAAKADSCERKVTTLYELEQGRSLPQERNDRDVVLAIRSDLVNVVDGVFSELLAQI